MKKVISFQGVDHTIEFRLINRRDRRELAVQGINLPDFGIENFNKLSQYLIDNCVTSGLGDDTPVGVETLVTGAIIEASYSPTADEAKN